MPITTSISALKSLFPSRAREDEFNRGKFVSPILVRARQQGGYERARMPNANDPMANRDMFASSNPTHVGSMSGQEFNSAMAKRGEEHSERYRRDADERGGLAKITQGINTVPMGKRWDAFFGALQNSGVDALRTGAAAGWERTDPQQVANAKGDHSYSNTFTTQRKGGWFDSEPVSALKQQGANYLQASDVNRNAATAQQSRQDEMNWELRARELDKKDAARGVTNTWANRKGRIF